MNDTATEYAKRLGKISPAQFQAALERFGLGDFVRAEVVPSGLFGQNVFVTSTRGEFVLRGAPHFPWQFPTERFFAEVLHKRTRAPVPYPYMVEPAADIFGWSFVIMPRLPGLQLTRGVTSQLSMEDRLEIARAMARTLVEVQMLTWDCAGKYDPETDSVRPFEHGYGTWIVQRIRENLAASRSYNDHTTGADVQWVESIIADASDACRFPDEPGAVLGDYGEHNVVVERTGNGAWHVSGVFDLMTAHFGDGKADLSLQVKVYLAQDPILAGEFVRVYLQEKPARPGFAKRQRLYMLNLSLSFWEYWQRERGGLPQDPAHSLSLEQWAEPSLAYWEEFEKAS